MAALWKQDGTLHPTFAAINRCLSEDWFLLPHELKLQRAHAQALSAAGLLSVEEHRALAGALARLERDHVGGPCPDSDAEDLHTWVEGRLTDLAGDAGRKIHTARSRNDQVATLLKMYAIDAGGGLAEALRRLALAFCQRGNDWSELVFPLHTHTQFAAPGTVGFWSLRYATACERLCRRFGTAVRHWREECPLGSGAVAGSSIPIDRGIQARLLGFDRPSWSALDSTTSRDECLELLALAAQTALHLQSFATDVIVFSQTAVAWTRYPKEFGTGSSMMPNKLNPDAMELLRGACCEIAAAHGQAVLLLKGLPSGYNRDLQCIKPLVRQTAARLAEMLELAAAFIGRLQFDPARLAPSLAQGHIGATLRMEAKVSAGMPLRQAHHATAEELSGMKESEEVEWSTQVHRYQTVGCASPTETRRVAAALMAALKESDRS